MIKSAELCIARHSRDRGQELDRSDGSSCQHCNEGTKIIDSYRNIEQGRKCMNGKYSNGRVYTGCYS